MGCETDILQPGQEVVIVGYGNADTGPYGTKREVTTTVVQQNGQEINIGGGGKDSAGMYEVLKKCGEPEAKNGNTWIYEQGNMIRV